MSYNTISEFYLNAFPSGSYNTIPSGTIQYYLDDAGATIDNALRQHNNMPLTIIPGDIKSAELVITSYRLLLWTGRFPQGGSADSLKRRYREIVGTDDKSDTGFLGKLANGKIILNPIVSKTVSMTPKIVSSATSNNWITYDSDKKQVIM